MPSYKNASRFNQRILNCNKKFDALFDKLEKGPNFKKQLQEVKFFYARAFNSTSNEEKKEAIVKEYEQFVITVSDVKSGKLTAQEGLEIIQDTAEERQSRVIIHNILKVCELFFWTTTAVAAYAACLSVGLPLLFLQPILGFAVSAGTTILFFTSLDNSLNCFEKFKSFDPINEEHTREKDIISFFSPKQEEKVGNATHTDSSNLSATV